METKVQTKVQQFGSLPVENVQALASKNIKNVPSRYIRPEVEFDVGSVDESLQIPLEEKMACAQIPNHIEGYGQAFVVSEDQKLDWGDMLFLSGLPVSFRNMRFWPTNPPSFRTTFDKYSIELHKVMMHLMRLFAKNLGTDPEMLASFFEDGTQGVRMNYYPPCAEASKVFGLAPHSDATGLTLLIQVNEVEGLQIKRYEKWVSVKPIPGAFIINIGDMLEIMSNGEYKSIEHRAVVNPEKERVSIAAFHNPKMGTQIGPLPDLVKANKALYRSLPLEEFLRLKMTSKLDGKHMITKMKL